VGEHAGALAQSYVPSTPRRSTMHRRMAVLGRVSSHRPGIHFLCVGMQSWRARERDGETLFLSDPSGVCANDFRYYQGVCTEVAVHPSGERLCLTLFERGAQDRPFLAERILDAMPPNRVEPVLIPACRRLRAARYDPTGSRLAYLCDSSEGVTELCVVRADGAGNGEQRIAQGELTASSFAFAPDGRRLVVSVPSKEGDNELLLLDLEREPAESIKLGPGNISRLPWHPTGEFLIVVADDQGGCNQLWVVMAEPPYERRQLTHLECAKPAKDAVGERPAGPAISRDGQWVVARPVQGDYSALVFFDLERLMKQPFPG